MICVLEQELLSGLVGIHGAILEHRVHIVVRVLLAGDLLDVLDDLPHVGRDRNPRGAAAAAAPAAAVASRARSGDVYSVVAAVAHVGRERETECDGRGARGII